MNSHVGPDIFLPAFCLSDPESALFVARATPSLQPLEQTDSLPIDIAFETPDDALFASWPQTADRAIVQALAKPNAKRKIIEGRPAQLRVRPKRRVADTSAPDPATQAAAIEVKPWYRRAASLDSVWTADPNSCQHSPQQDTWAKQTLRQQNEDPSVLNDIHLMMTLLASPIAPHFNSDIFRGLAQMPHLYRSDIAAQLHHVFQAPAAASASVRFQLLRKLPRKQHNDTLHALKFMLPYTRVSDPEMLLQIFMAVRSASRSTRETILPRIAQYLHVSPDATGACVAPLLRSCLRLKPQEAFSFCTFLSACHHRDPGSIQHYDIEAVRSATLVAVEDRRSFTILLDQLHRSFGGSDCGPIRPSQAPSPFLAPLARLHPDLRGPLTRAACEAFNRADEIQRTACRQRLLTDCADSRINDMLLDLRTSLSTHAARTEQTTSYCQALARIAPSMRRSIVQVCLDTITVGSAQALTTVRLRMLDHFAMQRLGHLIYSAEQLQDAVQRTLCILGHDTCGLEIISIFDTLLTCPGEQRLSLQVFVDALVCQSLNLRQRQFAVTEGLALGPQGREQMLQHLAPFAFTPEHDPATSYAIFLNLAYLYRCKLHAEVESHMRRWAADSFFSDVGPCVAAEVLYRLQTQVLAHRRGRISSFPPGPLGQDAERPTAESVTSGFAVSQEFNLQS